jgi:hypothetical protein
MAQRSTNRDARHKAGHDAGAVAFIATGISRAPLSVALVAALAFWALVRGRAA